MPFFKNLFSCSSIDNNENELDNIRERVIRLELKYDSLYQLLQDIKMSIEVVKIKLDLINQSH